MTFSLSDRSRLKLSGVHSDLERVVIRALEISETDFAVLEGVRSKERQAELKAAGASQTLDSRHLTGHAVDLGAMVGTEVRWDWSLYYKIAAAVKQAAEELEVRVIWGGCWDRDIRSLGDDLEAASLAYANRRKAAGQKAFMDGPHFELSRRMYP